MQCQQQNIVIGNGAEIFSLHSGRTASAIISDFLTDLVELKKRQRIISTDFHRIKINLFFKFCIFLTTSLLSLHSKIITMKITDYNSIQKILISAALLISPVILKAQYSQDKM